MDQNYVKISEAPPSLEDFALLHCYSWSLVFKFHQPRPHWIQGESKICSDLCITVLARGFCTTEVDRDIAFQRILVSDGPRLCGLEADATSPKVGSTVALSMTATCISSLPHLSLFDVSWAHNIVILWCISRTAGDWVEADAMSP